MPLSLTIVIPIFNSCKSIVSLVDQLEQLDTRLDLEVIYVDDGSSDESYSLLLERLKRSLLPSIIARHARNYGEHNAVLTGYRLAKGDYIVNLDDDLQNPPGEALRLLEHARRHEYDVLYGVYRKKYHSVHRNVGSKVANLTANLLLDLPNQYYFSSFRCVKASVAKEVAMYKGPYPYVDGLISQITDSISSLYVEHKPRSYGESGYNLRRLIRLWLNIFTIFSLMPLRFASILGIGMSFTGFLMVIMVVAEAIYFGASVAGWLSIFSAILIFGGIQCLLLGVMGEYLGRILLTISGKPQSFLRSIEKIN